MWIIYSIDKTEPYHYTFKKYIKEVLVDYSFYAFF